MRRFVVIFLVSTFAALATVGCENNESTSDADNGETQTPGQDGEESASSEESGSAEKWGDGRQTLPTVAPFMSPHLEDTEIPNEQALDTVGKKLRAMTFEQKTDGWDALMVSAEDFEGCKTGTNSPWGMSAEDIAEQKKALVEAMETHEVTGYSADYIGEMKSPVTVYREPIEGDTCAIEASANYNVQHGIEHEEDEVGLYDFDLYLVDSDWKIYDFKFNARDCDKEYVGNQRFCQRLNSKG